MLGVVSVRVLGSHFIATGAEAQRAGPLMMVEMGRGWIFSLSLSERERLRFERGTLGVMAEQEIPEDV